MISRQLRTALIPVVVLSLASAAQAPNPAAAVAQATEAAAAAHSAALRAWLRTVGLNDGAF